jgi:hypothetical protein
MLLTFSAFAQQGSGTLAACGPKGIQFEMKRDQSQRTLVQPDRGKARVYFVQDIGAVNCLGSCSTRIGVDGEWWMMTKGIFGRLLSALCVTPQAVGLQLGVEQACRQGSLA